MAPSFRRGQHVTIDVDGKQVDAVFVRTAEKHDGIDPDEVQDGDVSTVGWVQRAGSDELEGYLLVDINPMPEPDIRIAIGKAYEVMQEERREAALALTDELGASTGLNVQLEVTEYQPGRLGLGPIEWTAIFIGTGAATTVINKLTSDLYDRVKKMLLDRKAKGGRPNKGFVIYGPNGEVLRRWDTKNGDDDSAGNAEDDSGEQQ